MLKLTKRTTITLSGTAEDWELYNKPGRTAAAIEINLTIANAVNSGVPRKDAERIIWATMRMYETYGAMDSEAVWKLEALYWLRRH